MIFTGHRLSFGHSGFSFLKEINISLVAMMVHFIEQVERAQSSAISPFHKREYNSSVT